MKPCTATQWFMLLALLAMGPQANRARGDEKQDAAKQAQDEQFNMMVAQFSQQMRPALQAELNFIRQMCDLKPAQRPGIKAAGEAGLQAAAKKYVSANMKRQMGAMVWFGNAKPLDHRAEIFATLGKALEQVLSPEQMARYTAEHEKRTAIHKRAAILCVVSRLDDALLLTSEQREKIAQEIGSKWKPEWESWISLQVYTENFFPHELDPLVTPHLRGEQKSIWQTTSKINVSWANGLGMQQNPADDAWWEGKPAEPAPKKKKK